MTVQCIACDRFTLKTGSDEWARQGFGNCANREKFIMFGAVKDRDCGEHWPAPDAVVEKRRAWLKAKAANDKAQGRGAASCADSPGATGSTS
ncbi:MAG: hypothetical protein WC713_03995 [Candidatus Methylomirabilota bacterium]